jgi:hypothetical protein
MRIKDPATISAVAFYVLCIMPGFFCNVASCAPMQKPEPCNLTRAQVIAQTLGRYNGPSEKGVDPNTMTGKIMCGYQGWFTCPGDGSCRGWFHWGSGVFEPGKCTIDLWPDMSECTPNERYKTSFKFADGSPAYVFSSMNPKTVARHFEWMRDYGIDGVFVQRFVNQTTSPQPLLHLNTVLSNCRRAANKYGRVYAVMYDLSGLQRGQMQLAIDDWKTLVDKMRLGKDKKDKAYLHHNGKPVVAVWGVGFAGRAYSLDECEKFIDLLKNDNVYGGYTVMLGLPTYWQALTDDSTTDPKLHTIVEKCDIVSPWTVGRMHNLADVNEFAFARIWKPDMKWCKDHHKDYMPVVYPGFSWANLKNNPGLLNSIPRLKGQFLWRQMIAAKQCGATMIYQAMFDEMDEGTAIFKCTNEPPVGASKFLTYEGLPSDYYLWLVGQGTKMIRGEIPVTNEIPKRQQ